MARIDDRTEADFLRERIEKLEADVETWKSLAAAWGKRLDALYGPLSVAEAVALDQNLSGDA